MAHPIHVDQPVFLHDGDVAIGAVRGVRKKELTVYIENGGDFTISMDAVQDVHADKLILDGTKLDKRAKAAIAKAHAAEDNEDHAEIDE